MAIIDLFGPDNDNNGVADKLEELRANNWLVNDASLTFNIDNGAMGLTSEEPKRIYLYDLKNKRPLVDYYSDQNTPSSKPKYSNIDLYFSFFNSSKVEVFKSPIVFKKLSTEE